MRRKRTNLIWMAPAIVLVSVTNDSIAQSARVHVITWNLEQVTGSLELLESNRSTIIDSMGARTHIFPGDIAFIEFIGTIESTGSTGDIGEVTNGLLRLVDGTRYTGWSEVGNGEFVWRNWWAGTVRPQVDEITSFVEQGREVPPHAADEDVVVLVNGDRLEGLVVSIGENLDLERLDGMTITVPLERVRSIALVNPQKPLKGTHVWLMPGDEVSIESFRFDSGTGLRVGEHESLMPRSITAMAFNVGGLTPLARIVPVISQIPGSPRYRVPKPHVSNGAWPLDAPRIELSGPLRIEWPLEQGGMGFVARAILPPRARRLGNVELVILDGERELYSVTLDRRSPTAEIAVRLPGDSLVIELREADGGPLQDTVRLERALLLDPS